MLHASTEVRTFLDEEALPAIRTARLQRILVSEKDDNDCYERPDGKSASTETISDDYDHTADENCRH